MRFNGCSIKINIVADRRGQSTGNDDMCLRFCLASDWLHPTMRNQRPGHGPTGGMKSSPRLLVPVASSGTEGQPIGKPVCHRQPRASQGRKEVPEHDS